MARRMGIVAGSPLNWGSIPLRFNNKKKIATVVKADWPFLMKKSELICARACRLVGGGFYVTSKKSQIRGSRVCEFALNDSTVKKKKTEAGDIRMFAGGPWTDEPAHMHIALVTMEPNTLLIPHCMDADLIIFVQTGQFDRTPIKTWRRSPDPRGLCLLLHSIEREREMERWKQGIERQLAVFFFFMLIAISECVGESAPFLMKKAKAELLMKTEAGEVRMFRGSPWNGSPARMHIAIITMEPNSLMIPHYKDVDLIIFVQTGEAKIGLIHKNDLVESRLTSGSVFRVPAGSTFYCINTRKDQRLQMIATIQLLVPELIPSLSKPFMVTGGLRPPSLFNGFSMSTLMSAFNATSEEVGLLTSACYSGTIIFMTGKEDNHLHQVTGAMKSAPDKLKNSRRLEQDGYEEIEIEDKEKKRKGAGTCESNLSYVCFGEAATDKCKARCQVDGSVEAPYAYNVYDHDPDFKNDYGWSVEVNEHDYSPLKESDTSVFLVNLSAGSMMAPHWNPRATEYGVVTAGAGTVEVVYPNATAAMKAKVREGDMFWVPRFYPFCQVAAREGPMQIVGFTTSSRRNMPQFLVGKSSILRSMVGKELAPAFGMTEEELRHLVTKQEESVILPGW